jgi:hypothetical protein
MSKLDDDNAGVLVAFVSGALLGAAATLLFVRIQSNRVCGLKEYDDDYYYEGGDLFV